MFGPAVKVCLALMAQQRCSLALGHLFVHDTDEEEPLAGSQSCSALVGTAAVRLLQSLKPLEALVSYSEETWSQWKWQKSKMTQQSVDSKINDGHRSETRTTKFHSLQLDEGSEFTTTEILTVRIVFSSYYSLMHEAWAARSAQIAVTSLWEDATMAGHSCLQPIGCKLELSTLSISCT